MKHNKSLFAMIAVGMISAHTLAAAATTENTKATTVAQNARVVAEVNAPIVATAGGKLQTRGESVVLVREAGADRDRFYDYFGGQ